MDIVISDSMAILTYLADKHKKLTYPAGTKERAQQDSLTFAINDEIDSILWMSARHDFILPEDKRIKGINKSLRVGIFSKLQDTCQLSLLEWALSSR